MYFNCSNLVIIYYHLIGAKEWGGEQLILFYKNNNHEDRNEFSLRRHGVVLSAHATPIWIKNFERTGSTLKEKPPGRSKVRSLRCRHKLVMLTGFRRFQAM